MMKHHPGGSHTNHAIPDNKMAPIMRDFTTPQRQTQQHVAKKKRRQRDKGEHND